MLLMITLVCQKISDKKKFPHSQNAFSLPEKRLSHQQRMPFRIQNNQTLMILILIFANMRKTSVRLLVFSIHSINVDCFQHAWHVILILILQIYLPIIISSHAIDNNCVIWYFFSHSAYVYICKIKKLCTRIYSMVATRKIPCSLV